MSIKKRENLIPDKNNSELSSHIFYCVDKSKSNILTVPKEKKSGKHLKSKNPIKYSTVFMVDKENLKVTDEEIEINIENKELVTESLKDATIAVDNQKKTKTKWFNVVFFIVNILILIGILIYQLNGVGVAPLHKLEFFAFRYMIYACLLFLLIMIFETARTYLLIYKVTKQKRPFLSFKSAAICRYYDCITPFTTGGEPFEIFYLNSRGLNGGAATSVPLAKSLFNAFAFIVVSVVVLSCDSNLFGNNQIVVRTWGIISLVIAIAIMAIVILFSVSKKIMPKITMFTLKLLYKWHFIKDYHVAFNKCMRTMFEYQKSMKFYVKSIWTLLGSLTLSGLIVIVKALIPFFIYCAFNETVVAGAVLEIFSKFIIIELATKYIPLPGGSGVAEISFSALFASLFNDGTLFWAMLLYRVFNYFIYLAQGLIVIVYDFVHGNKKNKTRLAKEKEELLEYEESLKEKKTSK